jgi:protoheme IX farnesyltransferase
MAGTSSVGVVEAEPKKVEVDVETDTAIPSICGVEEESSTRKAALPLWKDYLLLTKPRVISLLLFTTWTAMVIAEGRWPGLKLFLATGLGFYMAAGAAHVVNMILDRDIDKAMKRTSERALASGRISVRNAAIFAAALGIGSFALLWTVATPLSAWMATSGAAFYVVVYTMLLKRRTWSNIVIGGAAGSFPPLVGWAAVTNSLPPLAWCLFAIIFLWTPVHFWALAILIKDDYAEVGIPMLPVVRGEKATADQICWYTVLTVAISLLPVVMNGGLGHIVSVFYLVSAGLLNLILGWYSWRLWREPNRARASSLFHYSMLYLALLFLALAVDRAVFVRF